jgi:hypothetical protein
MESEIYDDSDETVNILKMLVQTLSLIMKNTPTRALILAGIDAPGTVTISRTILTVTRLKGLPLALPLVILALSVRPFTFYRG